MFGVFYSPWYSSSTKLWSNLCPPATKLSQGKLAQYCACEREVLYLVSRTRRLWTITRGWHRWPPPGPDTWPYAWHRTPGAGPPFPECLDDLTELTLPEWADLAETTLPDGGTCGPLALNQITGQLSWHNFNIWQFLPMKLGKWTVRKNWTGRHDSLCKPALSDSKTRSVFPSSVSRSSSSHHCF